MSLERLGSVGRRTEVLRLAVCLAVCTMLVLLAPSSAAAQMVMNSIEHLSFGRRHPQPDAEMRHQPA
jgi:hypothetical protein